MERKEGRRGGEQKEGEGMGRKGRGRRGELDFC